MNVKRYNLILFFYVIYFWYYVIIVVIINIFIVISIIWEIMLCDIKIDDLNKIVYI